MSNETATERLLRRDRLIVAAGLAVIVLLAWLFVFDGAGTGMSVLAMTTWSFPPPLMPEVKQHWPPSYWLVMLVMWWVMMVAMMTPSAAPMILLYARVLRHSGGGTEASVPVATGWFVMGYLGTWLALSGAATALQWLFERLGLTHAMMMWSLERWFSAALLAAAGIYQSSSLKHFCLRQCRSPAQFLSRHWRAGRWGAARLGVLHGAYCVGCCWLVMALLFVGGIMNLVWIIGLAVLVLAEKVAPWGHVVAHVSGAALLGAAAYLAVGL